MRQIYKGSTSHSEYIALVDSTTGLPKTGIADTAVTGSYVRTRAARTAITVSALGSANAAFSSGGWFEVDSTNQPGLYRFDVPDNAFASGVDQVYVTVKATGCKTEHKEFRLVDWNNQVAALPNAVAGAAGGVFIAGSNADTSANITGNLTGNVSGSVGSVTGAVASVTGNVGGNVTGSIGSVAAGGITASSIAADAIGASELAADAAAEIATQVRAELTTELGRIDVAVSTRLASAGYTAPLDAAGVRSAVGLASANLDTQLSTIDDFLDTEVAAIKAKTDNLPSDPADQSAVEAAITAATAGLATAAALSTVDDFLDTEIAAIKAKTDNLPASPAAVGSAMTLTSGERTSIADAFLDRDMSTGTDSGSATVRTVRQALRKLRNKWSISGSTWSTYKEDDTTVSYTETLTTDSAADPVIGSDPASS
jgi:hypothetical protein